MTTIVMTGGSAGFGAVAVDLLSREPDVHLLIGARTASPDFIPVDLACLDSVRGFAEAVQERLGDTGIDVLALNAGSILPSDAMRTDDDIETTFAVNHLAHYLLVRLLMPSLAEEARIVITTSGTHDPALRTGLEAPRHADADLLAHPDRDPERHPAPQRAGQHAYSASKLCNVLTVRALRVHPDIRARHITALAYDPGQVFGTGLVRSLPRPRRIAWSVFGTALGAPLRRFDRTMNTRIAAGTALASLVSGSTTPPSGRYYTALRSGRMTFPDPSALARKDDVALALWNDSARMLGLPVDQNASDDQGISMGNGYGNEIPDTASEPHSPARRSFADRSGRDRSIRPWMNAAAVCAAPPANDMVRPPGSDRSQPYRTLPTEM